MLTFATEFPISSSASVDELIHLALKWIGGSRYTTLSKNILQWNGRCDEECFSNKDGSERIDLLRAQLPAFQVGGIQYTKTESELEWNTTVVGHKNSEGEFWIGVRVSCDALTAGIQIPQPKKPQIVRLILEELHGGRDGDFDVSQTPTRLKNDHVDFAASIINGRGDNLLPVIYVSATPRNSYAINISDLATNLSGVAHVVAEPNRAFSFRLMHDVDARNAYGGNIGLYWPKGQGRKIYSTKTNSSDLQFDIAQDIRTGLTARRPLPKCTWPFLSESAARVRYETLKADKSQSVEAYVAAFDDQLDGLNKQLEAANKEISRLQASVRALEAKSQSSSGSLISRGIEQDFYDGEIQDIIVDAIVAGASNVSQDSRRSHVLSAVLQANPKKGIGDSLAEDVKNALRDYRTLDSSCRSCLEDVGFSIADDGKHYKLIYNEDGRYTFALSKTSSDHRAGLNMASDIRKKIF